MRLCHGCQQAFDARQLAPGDGGGLYCPGCRPSFTRPTDGVVEPILEAAPPPRPALDREARVHLAIGVAVGLLFLVVPFLDWTGETLVTLIHELGHTVAYWSFGYFAIPAFDFTYGGGVTMAFSRSWFPSVALYAFAAWLVHRLWTLDARRLAVALGSLFAVHLLLCLTPAHETVIAFMGHGMELALAGVFVHRGLTGARVKVVAERPLYVGVGLYIAANQAVFSWRLMTDASFRHWYLRAKPGLVPDLVFVGRELGLSLPTVAGCFLFLCSLPIVVNGVLVLRRWRAS